MKLTQKQQLGFDLFTQGKNIFIEGPGGVGKSVLVRRIKEHFGENTVFLAPTGIAALNIGGSTIHSTFGFNFGILTKRDHTRIKDRTRDLFAKNGPVKTIVIDEVSMNRADIFNTIDQVLRRIRGTDIPFGGIQIVTVGDFFQLPPVVTNKERHTYNEYYDSIYAFGSPAWATAEFEHVGLDEIMRQSDYEFIKNLMTIRSKAPGYKESVEFFNHHGLKNQQEVLDSDPVFLCAVNKAADTVNEMNYSELDGKEYTYQASINGKFSTRPAPQTLKLRYGTKVIMTANTDDYKNGHVGYVIDFIGDKIKVLLEDDEREVLVEKFRWEEIEYGTSPSGELKSYPTGTYVQYPMKYGWAVTIHKAQGQSLSNAMIDFGRGAFCHGQAYVALSRLRTLDGLGLVSKMFNSDIIVDDEVNEFYKNGCRGLGLFS